MLWLWVKATFAHLLFPELQRDDHFGTTFIFWIALLHSFSDCGAKPLRVASAVEFERICTSRQKIDILLGFFRHLY